MRRKPGGSSLSDRAPSAARLPFGRYHARCNVLPPRARAEEIVRVAAHYPPSNIRLPGRRPKMGPSVQTREEVLFTKRRALGRRRSQQRSRPRRARVVVRPPATFRTNVTSASDPVVTKDSYTDIARDLSPTKTGTFAVSCGGKSFKDKVTTYSRREKYWKHELVVDHEAFHRKDWMDMYRTELVQAESEVWAHSLPVSDAADAGGAVAKANPELTKYMTDAYQRLCDSFTPKKESRAYDAGAPAYQKLVDDVNARAKNEKW